MGNNIFKMFYLLSILIFVGCNKMNEHKDNFEIFGEESLLKDIKLNVVKRSEIGLKKKETLIFNGEKYIVEEENETGFVYKIYVSYKDSLVNAMEYDNIMRGDDNQINHFYLYKNKDIVYFKFVGVKKNLQEMEDRPIHSLIPVDEYFMQKRICNEDSISKEKKLFFDFYGK